MTNVTCRLTAKNRDQLRDPTLSNRVCTTFTFLLADFLVTQCGASMDASLNGICKKNQLDPSKRFDRTPECTQAYRETMCLKDSASTALAQRRAVDKVNGV